MQKICIIVPTLGAGGAERVAVGMANYFSKTYDTTLITYFKNVDFYSIDDKVTRFNIYDNIKYTLGRGVCFLQRIIQLRKILKAKKPDIIITFLPSPATLAYFSTIGMKINIIAHERSNPYLYNRHSMQNIVKIWTAKRVAGFVFQTKRAQEYYPHKVIKKSIVIPNPVINPLIPAGTHKVRNNTITSMGRLEEDKGYSILIKAFAGIAKEFNNINLIIFGEGKDRGKYEEMIRSFGLEGRIRLPGRKPDAIVRISESRLFVFPSRTEGMPNALIESMAAGVPCISTNCMMGPAEIIDNYINGILIDVDDIEGMIYAMRKVLNDEGLAQKLSENARKIKQKHSPQIVFSLYENYIESILEK